MINSGGFPVIVRNDPSKRTTHQVDVAVLDGSGRLVSIGEAKLGVVMGIGHLERLRRIGDLHKVKPRFGDANPVLACYSAAGFSKDLRRAADNGDVVLIDAERLYTGS